MNFRSSLLIVPFLCSFSCCSSTGDGKGNIPTLKDQDITMEPAYETSTTLSDTNVLNCVLFGNDSVYGYVGKNIKKGSFYSASNINSFRVFLLQSKKENGDSLVVLIKPTLNSSYTNTVNVLDEMTINHIKTYAMVNIDEQEALFFNISVPKPSQQHKIIPPNTVTTLSGDNVFWVEIKDDETVWYRIVSSEQPDSVLNKVKDPVTSNLAGILARYKAKTPGTKKNYLIKGDKNSTYPTFEKVINAFKQNEIYKYNLVTSEDELSNQ